MIARFDLHLFGSFDGGNDGSGIMVDIEEGWPLVSALLPITDVNCGHTVDSGFPDASTGIAHDEVAVLKKGQEAFKRDGGKGPDGLGVLEAVVRLQDVLVAGIVVWVNDNKVSSRLDDGVDDGFYIIRDLVNISRDWMINQNTIALE
jgi:hypothetical protein